MSSFALEDFVGNGVLRDQIEALQADGWDDVPTLKMMSKEDMDTMQLSQLQRDALEIRTYLHDKLLMDYADTLEASGKNLSELLSTSPADLTAEYKMKRGHVARFLDRGSACGIEMPKNLVLPARKVTAAHHGGPPLSPPRSQPMSPPRSKPKSQPLSQPLPQQMTPPKQKVQETNPSDLEAVYPGMKIVNSANLNSSGIVSGPVANIKLNDLHQGDSKPPVLLQPTTAEAPPPSKGIFSAPDAQPRFCGLVKPAGVKEEVSQLSTLDKIMISKIAPQHSKGVNPFKNRGPIPLPAPTPAAELWAEKPTLILVLRRPGCVMCRAEAHQLYSRKPIFDAMGVQLVAIVNEHIDAEVRAFWPRYWGGMVAVDENREFFKALGQGELPTEGFVSGFLLNAAARANFKRARATGVEGNYSGEGTIKGGLYIMRPGNGGVAYQFVERNFGDWAPLEEVLEVCGSISRR